MRHSGLALSIATFAAGGVFAALTFALRFDTTQLTPVKRPNIASSIQIDGDEPSLLASHVLLDRPLFNPTRRPFVEPKQEAATEPAAEPEIEPEFVEEKRVADQSVRLLGVAKLDGQPIALVAEGEHAEARWLKLGDAIGNWTITAVDRSTIVLAHQSADAKLRTIPMFTGVSEAGDADIE